MTEHRESLFRVGDDVICHRRRTRILYLYGQYLYDYDPQKERIGTICNALGHSGGQQCYSVKDDCYEWPSPEDEMSWATPWCKVGDTFVTDIAVVGVGATDMIVVGVRQADDKSQLETGGWIIQWAGIDTGHSWWMPLRRIAKFRDSHKPASGVVTPANIQPCKEPTIAVRVTDAAARDMECRGGLVAAWRAELAVLLANTHPCEGETETVTETVTETAEPSESHRLPPFRIGDHVITCMRDGAKLLDLDTGGHCANTLAAREGTIEDPPDESGPYSIYGVTDGTYSWSANETDTAWTEPWCEVGDILTIESKPYTVTRIDRATHHYRYVSGGWHVTLESSHGRPKWLRRWNLRDLARFRGSHGDIFRAGDEVICHNEVIEPRALDPDPALARAGMIIRRWDTGCVVYDVSDGNRAWGSHERDMVWRVPWCKVGDKFCGRNGEVMVVGVGQADDAERLETGGWLVQWVVCTQSGSDIRHAQWSSLRDFAKFRDSHAPASGSVTPANIQPCEGETVTKTETSENHRPPPFRIGDSVITRDNAIGPNAVAARVGMIQKLPDDASPSIYVVTDGTSNWYSDQKHMAWAKPWCEVGDRITLDGITYKVSEIKKSPDHERYVVGGWYVELASRGECGNWNWAVRYIRSLAENHRPHNPEVQETSPRELSDIRVGDLVEYHGKTGVVTKTIAHHGYRVRGVLEWSRWNGTYQSEDLRRVFLPGDQVTYFSTSGEIPVVVVERSTDRERPRSGYSYFIKGAGDLKGRSAGWTKGHYLVPRRMESKRTAPSSKRTLPPSCLTADIQALHPNTPPHIIEQMAQVQATEVEALAAAEQSEPPPPYDPYGTDIDLAVRWG